MFEFKTRQAVDEFIIKNNLSLITTTEDGLPTFIIRT